jgi:dienelactone hydrolase
MSAMQGAVLEFPSPVDGQLHPVAACATDDGPQPKALLLEVSPGAIADLDAAVRITEELAAVAAGAGISAVILRPTGRGPGTVYQDAGEVDVLEAIAFAASRWPVDRDRITITGTSMGGAATWYLLAHRPELFAAGAPFCGYADYRLWAKPGGLAFPTKPWEEPSWQARSAVFHVQNLDRIPLWVIHGAWDRAVGGGVSIEHSRAMVRALQARSAPVRYTEVPGAGHDVRAPELFHEVVRWLLAQRRTRDPDRVTLATFELRHNASRWLRIEQLARYGERAAVEAQVGPDAVLRVTTDNVRTLTLERPTTSLLLDRQPLGPVAAGGASFRRAADGRWSRIALDLGGEKRHGSSGPAADLFRDGVIVVPGTVGGEEATFFNRWVAQNTADFYRARNGGVHRGGIQGVNWIDLPVIADTDLTDQQRAGHSLLLVGTPATNGVLREWASALDVSVGPSSIRVADREWTGDGVAAFAVRPHPEHGARIVAIHGGSAPDAVTAGSHLDLALLPDYLAYAGGETLEWGFWGNDWRAQEDR